jgi:hypothetical protein
LKPMMLPTIMAAKGLRGDKGPDWSPTHNQIIPVADPTVTKGDYIWVDGKWVKEFPWDMELGRPYGTVRD